MGDSNQTGILCSDPKPALWATLYYCASCLFRPNRCDHLEDSKCRESRARGIPSQTWPQTPPHTVFRFWPDRWSVVWLIGFPFLVTSVSPSLPPFLFWLLVFCFSFWDSLILYTRLVRTSPNSPSWSWTCDNFLALASQVLIRMTLWATMYNVFGSELAVF